MSEQAPQINIDTYGVKDVPAAADHRRGARDLADVNDAIGQPSRYGRR
jgi:hypothetical protein